MIDQFPYLRLLDEPFVPRTVVKSVSDASTYYCSFITTLVMIRDKEKESKRRALKANDSKLLTLSRQLECRGARLKDARMCENCRDDLTPTLQCYCEYEHPIKALEYFKAYSMFDRFMTMRMLAQRIAKRTKPLVVK